MNKTILLMMLLAVFLVPTVAADGLDVSLTYDPYPVHPGDLVDLEFEVTNHQFALLENISFELDVGNDFTLASGKDRFISSLEPGETKTIAYKIYVDGSAREGIEEVSLEYKLGDDSFKEDFEITIAPRQVYLQVTDVITNPEKVAPGDQADIKIKVKNTAESEIKEIILKLAIEELPFAPESVTERRIDELNDGEERQVSFTVDVLSTAEIQIYKIPLLISYSDAYGNSYQKSDTISLEVFEEPDIAITIEENNLVIGMNSKIEVKILNKGLAEVNFAEIRLLDSPDYDFKKGYEYIGNIESDDYEVVEFEILPKKERISLQFELEYKDSSNKEYRDYETFNVKVYTIREAQALGLVPRFPWALIVIIIIIVFLIIFFSAKKRRRKRLQQMNNS
ncbi:MAG: COG1361 S-layer family protein [archaeon]|nr:MAG: COG1361 S-layer family protein [archaeon]